MSQAHLERETGFEPATNSLEGCDSSQLSYSRKFQNKKEPDFTLYSKYYVGGEGFEPPKAHANGFTVRPGSPTPASAQKNAKLKASDKYIFIQIKMQII